VFEPLDMRLEVAEYLTLKADRLALVDRLIAGTSHNDRWVRQTRYNASKQVSNITMTLIVNDVTPANV